MSQLNNLASRLCFRVNFVENLVRKNKHLYNIMFGVIFILLSLTILFLNIKTPLIGDDFVYSFIYQTEDRLGSINDVFFSQYLHYYQWGGRSVVHVITQLLLLTDNNLIIDIFNTIAFMAFILVIQYHIIGRLKNNISILIISFSLTWFVQPVFAETVLWITGSSNYLWGTLIVLLFLLPYRLCKNAKTTIAKSIICSALMFFLGILAGWTNENTAAAMIVMIICFIYYNQKIENKKVPLWMYFGLLGSIVGYIIMIIAPGNMARAEGASIDLFIIVYRTLTYTQRFVNYLGLLNLGLAILLIIYMSKSGKNRSRTLKVLAIYLLGTLVSIYIMIASPGFPARAWFGAITFNIIAFGILYYEIDYSSNIIKRSKLCILVFCLISFSASYYDAYKDVVRIDNIWKDRVAIIAKKKNENETTVSFKEYQAKTKFGLGDTPYALPYISSYYGIEFYLDK